ncbi:MAG: D-2-hydroxyacid dehydrogenase [Eubacteriales bacterium]
MNITVLMPFDEQSRVKFSNALRGADITYAYDHTLSYMQKQSFDRDKYGGALCGADIVIGQPPPDMLPDMRRLMLLQLSMAGTEPYSRPGVVPPNVRLCSASGAYGAAISEHMLACALMLIKKLHLYRDNMARGAWLDRGDVLSLSDMTIACIGLGDIGCHFAWLCSLMGAHIIGVRRAGLDMPDYVDELYHADSIDAVISRADITALSMPDTPQTAGMFSAQRISRMKCGSILINVGRGNAVDTDALAAALSSGQLSGAAIDVSNPEPLPSCHPLWRCENTIITPHISGFYHLRKTYDDIVDIALKNALAVYENGGGAQLISEVDRATGYRVTQRYSK